MTEQNTAHFLTDIEIKEFKCFKDFKASGFKRVNLIGGRNNVGKTAFMEACFINTHSKNIQFFIDSFIKIKFQRERSNSLIPTNSLLPIKNLTHRECLDSCKSYKASSNLKEQEFKITLDKQNFQREYEFSSGNENHKIKFHDDANFDFNLNLSKDEVVFLINSTSDIALSQLYQSIQRKKYETILNSYIKEFDSSIEVFNVIGDKPQCEINGEWQNITEFGDGLKNYISIICALYACENGYLFIDEIDNGIYYENFDRLWEIILTLSKQTNCQVFATTHSKEMVESFARVAKKLDEQDISYTRIVKNKKQELKSIAFNYEVLEYSLENEHEVR